MPNSVDHNKSCCSIKGRVIVFASFPDVKNHINCIAYSCSKIAYHCFWLSSDYQNTSLKRHLKDSCCKYVNFSVRRQIQTALSIFLLTSLEFSLQSKEIHSQDIMQLVKFVAYVQFLRRTHHSYELKVQYRLSVKVDTVEILKLSGSLNVLKVVFILES